MKESGIIRVKIRDKLPSEIAYLVSSTECKNRYIAVYDINANVILEETSNLDIEYIFDELTKNLGIIASVRYTAENDLEKFSFVYLFGNINWEYELKSETTFYNRLRKEILSL